MLLASSSVILLSLSVFFQFSRFYHGDYPGKRFLTFAFNVNRELNVPTLFSTLQLLLCGVLALHLARASTGTSRDQRSWKVLSLLLLVMAAEEMLSLRTLLSYGLGLLLDWSWGRPGGVIHFLWVLPGVFFVVVVGRYFLRFVLGLPSEIRNLIVVSGAMYVFGSLGMEMASGVWIEAYGQQSPAYSLLTTGEEAFEMFALSLLAYAFLRHLLATKN